MKSEEVKLHNKIYVPVDRHNGKSLTIARYVENIVNPKVYCKFCGRVLKNRKSKLKGYGQSCYDRWVSSRDHKRRLI